MIFQENENVDEMPQEARQHWLAACSARAAARKADSYIKELRVILWHFIGQITCF